MTRKVEDRTGGPATGGDAATRDARLRAALRQNLARRKARAYALARPATPPHEGAAEDMPVQDPSIGPAARMGVETVDLPPDPAKDD